MCSKDHVVPVTLASPIKVSSTSRMYTLAPGSQVPSNRTSWLIGIRLLTSGRVTTGGGTLEDGSRTMISRTGVGSEIAASRICRTWRRWTPGTIFSSVRLQLVPIAGTSFHVVSGRINIWTTAPSRQVPAQRTKPPSCSIPSFGQSISGAGGFVATARSRESAALSFVSMFVRAMIFLLLWAGTIACVPEVF
ncbi:hypothetical protein D9M73_156630 [compost metagenome]